MPGCAEWRWRWCDSITPGSLIMSSPWLLPSSYLQSHSACITERLLTGLTPRLPRHTPPSKPVPKQVANTPHNFTFWYLLFLGKHFSAFVSRWGDKAKQLFFFLFFFFFNFPKLHTRGLVTAKVDKSFSFVPDCSINQLHKACWREADKSLGHREHRRKQPGFVFCCSGFHTH